MKTIALVATSLALLSAAASAQDTQPIAKTIKVTNGLVVTLYSIPKNEIEAGGSFASTSGKAVIYKRETEETQLEGSVTIRLGKSLTIYADKAILTSGKDGIPSIILQSDGRIETNEGEHKVTQFASEGTRIEGA